LKVGINPHAESVKKASREGNNGSGLQGLLMNFHKEVKVGERIKDGFRVVVNEAPFSNAEFYGVCGEPSLEERLVGGDSGCRFIWEEALVRGGIGEMITYGESDIFVSFDDRRAEIFIAVGDNEIGLATKVVESVAVVLSEVRHSRARLEETVKMKGKLEQTVLQEFREVLVRWVPVGGVLQLRVVGCGGGSAFRTEKTMDAEATFQVREAGPNLLKMREPGSLEGCRNEL
jgi:hypothetical protein